MADDRLPALEEIRRREQEAIPGPWLAREVYREGKPRWQLALGNDPYKRLLIDAPKSETWPGTTTGEFIARSREDVPRLLAALDAVLKLPGEWEADAAELDRDVISGRKSHYVSDHRQADTDEELARTLRECAGVLREAVTRALTGEGSDGA